MNVVTVLNNIIHDAIRLNASDLHFEQYRNNFRIRFRIDGVLHPQQYNIQEIAKNIISRLKILAKLDITEQRIPQDGRFTVKNQPDNEVDCRLSSCPTIYGEKIVIRLLDPHAIPPDLAQLGLAVAQQQLFLTALQQPQGMILVTGPTGSGKTITLYAALKLLNTSERNIISCEDPVEIILPGINQVNVQPQIGFNFAMALRAFLRQDPDLIMIGEIRDSETAQIAIKAAQTGHLVLSTLHCNSTAEASARLKHLGVTAYDIASSVHLIIAQRLIRLVCGSCKATGCSQCHNGYHGRTAIFEFLSKNQKNSNTLAQEAKNKVAAGLTTMAEIRRVCGSNSV